MLTNWLFRVGGRSTPQHSPAQSRPIRVDGSSGLLDNPWGPGPRSCHRTDVREQGEGLRAQTGSLNWKTLQLSFYALEFRRAAGCQSLTAYSALMLEGRSVCSVFLGESKGIFIYASRQCIPRLPKEDRVKPNVGHILDKDKSLLP